MKAFLIDPTNLSNPISPIDLIPGELPVCDALSDKAHGMLVSSFAEGFADEDDNVWLVDAEGALSLPAAYTLVRGADRPLAGRAVVVGLTPEGERTDANIDEEGLRAMTAVFSNKPVAGFGVALAAGWAVGTAMDVLAIAPDQEVATALTSLQTLLDEAAVAEEEPAA